MVSTHKEVQNRRRGMRKEEKKKRKKKNKLERAPMSFCNVALDKGRRSRKKNIGVGGLILCNKLVET